MNLKAFSYKSSEVRTVVKGEDVWFVAKDVCEVLGIKNVSDAVLKLKDKFKTTIALTDTGSNYKTTALLVNEAGLYKLIFKSRKAEAEKFSDWVAEEVLPSIRKHGMYAKDEILDNPDLLIEVATKLKQEREARLALEQQYIQDKPKILFASAVEVSESSILIGELSKLLRQNNIDIGQNRLFEWLRENGYLIKKKGESFNLPTQYSMDLQLFEIKKRVINNPDGSIRTTRTSKVTGKGQIYFINKFLENQSA